MCVHVLSGGLPLAHSAWHTHYLKCPMGFHPGGLAKPVEMTQGQFTINPSSFFTQSLLSKQAMSDVSATGKVSESAAALSTLSVPLSRSLRWKQTPLPTNLAVSRVSPGSFVALRCTKEACCYVLRCSFDNKWRSTKVLWCERVCLSHLNQAWDMSF